MAVESKMVVITNIAVKSKMAAKCKMTITFYRSYKINYGSQVKDVCQTQVGSQIQHGFQFIYGHNIKDSFQIQIDRQIEEGWQIQKGQLDH